MRPDVESLLINRVAGRDDCLIAPIDACFALVGLIRTRWRGLAGGAEVWQAVEGFFAQLREGGGPCPS
jgi:hypothetical protein